MNRSLTNVIFGGIAPTQTSEGEIMAPQPNGSEISTYIDARLDEGAGRDKDEH
jgi:hypothetical protein